MSLLDKHALVARLREDLSREIAVMARAAQETRAAATHEEAKPENDKDTRAIEAGYLAGAQAERVRELERVATSLARLELQSFGPGSPISSSAMVRLDQEGTSAHYFLAPHGGGLRVTLGGVEVQVITPPSPLGQALLGKTAGDTIELIARGKKREYEICEVW